MSLREEKLLDSLEGNCSFSRGRFPVDGVGSVVPARDEVFSHPEHLLLTEFPLLFLRMGSVEGKAGFSQRITTEMFQNDLKCT